MIFELFKSGSEIAHYIEMDRNEAQNHLRYYITIHTPNVHTSLPWQLVLSSAHKLELIDGYADTTQHGLDDHLVVVCAMRQQVPRSLHVVQVGVQVRKQNCHLHEEPRDEWLAGIQMYKWRAL